jgi:SAM-dependent methyltransferase
VPKTYDRAYFDRWYRGHNRVNSSAEVRRKVAMAVSIAEYFLRRPIRSVLDVGCGEGAWFPHLRALRPRLRYDGVDPSDYAVERFGAERHIRKGAFGELASVGLRGTYDLVICADVLHYVPDAEIVRGLGELTDFADGLVYLEVLTKEDDIVGDLDGFLRRPGAWYRKTFRNAGLVSVGPYAWASPRIVETLAEMERT